MLAVVVIALYGLCLAFIFCYSLVQLHLTILYWLRRHHGQQRYQNAQQPGGPWPAVTVQLPVYNERYVVARLLRAIAAFDYPHEQLQIQVLDDSTDDTTSIIDEELRHYPQLHVEHICRAERVGYKAGALQHGLRQATGEYIAIFDADFLPSPDFLKRTLAAFAPDIGLVQTRWSHLNASYSLLTRLQAFGLNAHFSVEQAGRCSGGHFINFNGTAGIWRKTCIEEAGGWQADTLTEDLDLSYRAQLKGWRFTYLEEVEAPAELPAAMGAVKSQQFRWTKGAAETARKHLTSVLRAPQVPLSTKLHATFHLLNSAIFICILLSAILSVPMLFIKHTTPEWNGIFKLGTVLLLSLAALIGFYWTALYQQGHSAWHTTRRFAPDFFLFLALSMGLSLHNSLAVLEGYLGKKSPFIRTPKYNLLQAQDSWRQRSYFMESIHPVTVLEGLLALYFGFGIWQAFRLGDFGLLPFHVLLALGFGSVFVYSLLHSRP